MGTIVYIGKISGNLEEEYYGKVRKQKIELCNYKRVLADLKQEFGKEDNEMMKVVKLKKVE